jgi:hypothetical protein
MHFRLTIFFYLPSSFIFHILFSKVFLVKYLCVVHMLHAQLITIRMTLRVFLIPDKSCCLRVLTGISRLCGQVATSGRRREPGTLSKTETINQLVFTLTVNMVFFSVLFNDAYNCYVHTASVTEECRMILTGENRSAFRTSTATLSTTNPIEQGIGPG